MQQNADTAIQNVLVSEGEYVYNSADNGGPTNKGITLTSFRRYIKPKATIADLKALTTEQAVDVYRQQYWNAVRADELPSGIDYSVFDFGVNSGPTRAIKYMQVILNKLGYYNGGIDGKIGPLTLVGVSKVDPKQFITQYNAARLAYLELLDDWPVFGDGWTNRVKRVKAASLKMVSSPKATKQSLWTWIVSLLQRLFKRTT